MSQAKHNTNLSWYRMLSTREQQLIAILVFVVIFCVVIFGMLAPLHRSVAQARQQYVNEQQLLQWMQEKVPTVQKPAAGARTYDAVSLPTMITQVAGEFDIRLGRVEVDDSNVATVTLEKISFNQLVNWLDTMETAHQVSVISLNVSKTEDEQTVNASVKIQG